MLIKPSDFLNGGEADITAHYQSRASRRTGRLSIRRVGFGLPYGDFEVYVKWHGTTDETVLKAGTLQECVFFTNKATGEIDEVGE